MRVARPDLANRRPVAWRGGSVGRGDGPVWRCLRPEDLTAQLVWVHVGQFSGRPAERVGVTRVFQQLVRRNRASGEEPTDVA
jgi:hypothetical protein